MIIACESAVHILQQVSLIDMPDCLRWLIEDTGYVHTSAIYAGEESSFDKVIDAVGKLGFIPQFSYFPVQYMDSEGQLAVFSFPPLNSNITIMRVTGDKSQ